MINHARTLLLNRDGNNRPDATFFLEEYVPADFRAQALPRELLTVHNILLSGDDAFVNYRLWQLMGLLHSTEFSEYVTMLDPRVTYLHRRSILNEGFFAHVETLEEGSEVITPLGTFLPQSNRLLYGWEITKNGTQLTTRDLHTGRSNEGVLLYTNGLSAPLPLVGQAEYSVALSGAPGGTGRWQLDYLHMPDSDVSQLIPLLSTSALQSLFRPTGYYPVFRELWEKHSLIQYRLTGVVLALAYRLEELRINGR